MPLYQASQKVAVGDHFLAYDRRGKGDPLVFIHGITTYGFIWKDLADHFSRSHDVITVDLMGCGNSDKPLSFRYSLNNHAQMIKKALDTLKINQCHMVCHDVGGGIGQVFAVNFPDRLIDLTLVNTVAYDFWPVQPIIAMKTPIIRQLAMATLDFGALEFIIKRGVYHKEKLTETLMAHFRAPMETKTGRKAFLHFAKSLDNQDLLSLSDQISAITLPVLIVRGEADVYLSQSISEKLHDAIHSSHLVRIRTGGHFVQIDEPSKLIAILDAFFSRTLNADG